MRNCAPPVAINKRGGLNGSMQHLLAVYPPESQIPELALGFETIAKR
jgi:hypothetical protein